MSLTEAVKSCLSKYVVWQGRASRAEYWWFALAYVVCIFATALLGVALHTEVLAGLVLLGGVLPGLSVTIRRLHDTGRDGAWYWVVFIPFVGGIALLVLTCQAGQPEVNAYGPPAEATLAPVRQPVRWASLGVDADARLAGSGVQVTAVEPGGVAAEAGIEPGDVILTVGGMSVRTSTQLERRWQLAAQGRVSIDDEVDLDCVRGGARRVVNAVPLVDVQWDARPASSGAVT